VHTLRDGAVADDAAAETLALCDGDTATRPGTNTDAFGFIPAASTRPRMVLSLAKMAYKMWIVITASRRCGCARDE
jgi:hypothetical protein